MRTCRVCGETKALADFPRSPTGHWHRRCTHCTTAAAREWRQANLERQRKREREYRRRVRPERELYLCAKEAEEYARRKGAEIVELVVPLVLLERDDGVCGICGEDVDPLDCEIDHVVAILDGGEHSYANTQIAHRGCNGRKGNAERVARAA